MEFLIFFGISGPCVSPFMFYQAEGLGLSPRGKVSECKARTINILKIDSVIDLKKLLIHSSLIGLMVESRLNR